MKWIRITFLIISAVVLLIIAYAIINSMVSYKYEMEEPPKLYEINIEFKITNNMVMVFFWLCGYFYYYFIKINV